MRDVIVRSDGTKLGQDITIGEFRLRADHEAADKAATTPGRHASRAPAGGPWLLHVDDAAAYAERKGWPLQRRAGDSEGRTADGKYAITRQIRWTAISTPSNVSACSRSPTSARSTAR